MRQETPWSRTSSATQWVATDDCEPEQQPFDEAEAGEYQNISKNLLSEADGAARSRSELNNNQADIYPYQ